MPLEVSTTEIEKNNQVIKEIETTDKAKLNGKLQISEKKQEGNSIDVDANLRREALRSEFNQIQDFVEKNYDKEIKEAIKVRNNLFFMSKQWEEINKKQKYPDSLLKNILYVHKIDHRKKSCRCEFTFGNLNVFVSSELRRRQYFPHLNNIGSQINKTGKKIKVQNQKDQQQQKTKMKKESNQKKKKEMKTTKNDSKNSCEENGTFPEEELPLLGGTKGLKYKKKRLNFSPWFLLEKIKKLI